MSIRYGVSQLIEKFGVVFLIWFLNHIGKSIPVSMTFLEKAFSACHEYPKKKKQKPVFFYLKKNK